MDPYSSAMGMNQQNLLSNPLNPQHQPSSNSYQTEDIFAMLDKLNEKKQESQM